MAKGKEVAKVEDGPKGVEVLDDAAMIAELEGVAGAGSSDRQEDKGTPLLYIAQKGSPQIDKKQTDKFIPGLEQGDIFNPTTKEFWKGEADGVPFLPVFFQVVYNKWTPRDEGGGYHGQEPRDTPLLGRAKPKVDEKSGKARRDVFVLPDGMELVLTHNYYGILADTWRPAVIAMASSQLTPSRHLQSLIDAQKIMVNGAMVTKPAFWNTWRFKTVYRDDGDNQWYVWAAQIDGPNDNPQLRALCKEFALSAKRNEVKIAAPMSDEEATGSDHI
jgi:hypothetical protein